MISRNLRRWWTRENIARNLRLPAQLILAENLSPNGEAVAPLEQTGAHHDLGPEDGLVVVDVRCAVGAVVAVYWLACGWGSVSLSLSNRPVRRNGAGGKCEEKGGKDLNWGSGERIYQSHRSRCRSWWSPL